MGKQSVAYGHHSETFFHSSSSRVKSNSCFSFFHQRRVNTAEREIGTESSTSSYHCERECSIQESACTSVGPRSAFMSFASSHAIVARFGDSRGQRTDGISGPGINHLLRPSTR